MGVDCPRHLQTLLKLTSNAAGVEDDEPDLVEVYLLFCNNILTLFEEVVKKLERNDTTSADLYAIMHSFLTKLSQRRDEGFYGYLTKQKLQRLSPSDADVARQEFTALLKHCHYLHLVSRQNISMDMLYDECVTANNILKHLTEHDDWVSKGTAEKWMAVLQAAVLPNILAVVSFVLSIPSSTGKLNTEHKALTSELEKVFGPGLEIKVEDSSEIPEDPIQAVTIALIAVSVLLAIIIVTFSSSIIHLNVRSVIGNVPINCATGSNYEVGSILEGYEGDVEIITNIGPENHLVLGEHLFPIGVTFLELVYSDGDSTATVRTVKPLDADVLQELKNIRTLRVLDVNDNPPIFQSKSYSVTVSETTAVGSDVLRVTAKDADVSTENNRITYSIQPPAPVEFEMRGDGNIRLKQRLNYNIDQQYTFTVEAKDVGGLSDTTTVTITVEDFDNLNPYFDHSLYKASIEENQVGQFSDVTPEAIKAQDGDTGINEPVVYSITAVLPNEYQSNFIIIKSSGVISVTTALDREEIDQITVHIQATQQDDASKTANAVVSVTIEDVDDNPPKFDQDEYIVSILENSPQDQFVLQTRVTDLDLVEAQEKPPSTNKATADVTIVLLDENDNSPQFTTSKYQGKVYGNQTVGMQVVKVEATDLDEGPNSEISYSIEFGNEGGYFGINENDGEITLVQTIPLVENRILQFSLYVTAKDGGAISRSTSAMVDVKAPGDSHPQFLQKTYQGQVEEDQTEADIVKVDFLSIDPIVPVILTVESEAEKFSINQDTGVLSTKVKLDFEEESSYTVLLSISDGTNRDEASVLVEVLDINDNSPVFESHLPSVSVPEDHTVGDDVTSVKATDADAGFNGEVRYTLLGGAGRFSVDQETGVITLAAPLDRETQDVYHLVITAQDQGRPSRSTTTTLDISVTDINDNAPIFSKQQYEITVSEHAEVGTAVVDVMATDKDDGANAIVTYHIVKQEPSSASPVFIIDAESGSISLAEKLDYGKAKRYNLEVEGRDGGIPVLTGSATVTVWVEDVNDKAPVFSKDQYDVSVYENLAGGTALVSLDVTDEDEVIAVDQPVDGLSSTAQVIITVLDVNDNNPQFLPLPEPIEIQEGVYTSSSPGEVCEILATDADIGDNGRVTITTSTYSNFFSFRDDGTLQAIEELDRETQDVYDVVIVAMDHGMPQGNNITTVRVSITDVNDNAPVFSSDIYSKSILVKDAKVGDVLLTVSAPDKDAGSNALISYRFSEDSSMVALDAETGDITLTSDLSEVTEDTLLTLTAIATDHGTPPESDEAEVLIYFKIASLTDSVAFESSSYKFTIKENEPEASEVGKVKALTGSSAVTVSYKIKSDEDVFSVDGEGTIKALRPLDKEEEEWYILTVEAIDSRTPPNTAETTVNVQVENVNEAPVFDNEIYEAEIFSFSPYKFPIVKVQASDPDVGESSELQYSLQESTTLLDVEANTGQIYVLDASSFGDNLFTFHAKATDKHGLSTTTTVQITVKKSASNNVVVISLNQPVFTVEKKIPEIENSMKKALGWTVKILSVRAEDVIEMRTILRDSSDKTYISFIAMDSSGAVIPATEVKQKVQSNPNGLKEELEKVFDSSLDIKVEEGSGISEDSEDSSAVAIIALSVLLAISIVGFVALLTVYLVRMKKMKKDTDSDKESFNIGKPKISSIDKSFKFHNKKDDDKEVKFSNTADSERYSENDTDLRNGNSISAL
ncbi:Protocadherin Fat 4 [Anabarilius grahami]|uniref:Protocadherin Fat 4 n=1 Tax=Anabarilius grahami TaxID=495550 RepID=A0A3N0Z0I6_ANAGA|nr:Protocadherin Fat 4 [Anabarilius grahami]